MTPEQMTPDLELCKHESITELFDRKAHFWWCYGLAGNYVHEAGKCRRIARDGHHAPAPTVAEMGVVLRSARKHPYSMVVRLFNYNYLHSFGQYSEFDGAFVPDFSTQDKKEANARAQMIVWLHENGHLKLGE